MASILVGEADPIGELLGHDASVVDPSAAVPPRGDRRSPYAAL